MKSQVCDEKHGNINERCVSRNTTCDARFDRNESDIKTDKVDIRSINRKINMLLVTVVMVLGGVIVELALTIIRSGIH